MTQAIDAVKLKAAVQHLEWVLRQYPESEEVRALLCSLVPLMEDIKRGNVLTPLGRTSIPGAWNFSDGRYVLYRSPSVDEAYSDFITELEGGLTEDDRKRIARLDAMRRAMVDGAKP